LPRLSPDGKKVAFVRDNDLYVYDLAAKKETRLTSDGSETVLNGTLSWLYWEEIFDRGDTGYWWAPDSSAIAFLRTDESKVDVSSFTDFAPAVPRVIKQRYPRTGGENPSVKLGVVGAAGGPAEWMNPADAPYEYIVGVAWLPDSRSVAVQTTNRPQTKLDVWRFDRGTFRTTLVLSRKRSRVRLPEGDSVPGRRENLDRFVRERRAHASLPLSRRRRSAKRRHEGPLVGAPRVLLRRPRGIRVYR
jgi:hypothetical protein